MTHSAISRLLDILGYSQSEGYVEASRFDHSPSHRHALLSVRDKANVIGCFGLLSKGLQGHSIFTPLTLLAEADDRDGVLAAHRSVWNHGLFPYLLVIQGDSLWICDGFRFRKADWPKAQADNISLATFSKGCPSSIAHLQAAKLSSILCWKAKERREGHVDDVLLDNLDKLARRVHKMAPEDKPYSWSLINRLIGRLLYVFFLRDRGLLPDEWLLSKNIDIQFSQNGERWSKKALWNLFSEIDDIFNGGIFNISPEDWSAIDEDHIDDLRQVMRHHATVHASALQLGFLNFDYSSLRTETLSSIYERFLARKGGNAQETYGAYYTPAFVADYMLDRVEEHIRLSPGTRVLDGACGSGVFLVGAFRRMVEARLEGTQKRTLPLNELTNILLDNIRGIELDPEAAQVTAFSLYLTLIDYVSDDEIEKVRNRKAGRKLFPCLIGENRIIQANLFDNKSTRAEFRNIDVVVGNPPWGSIDKLADCKPVQKYYEENKKHFPVGKKQAAELFVWRLMNDFVKDSGFACLLIPGKSFLNSDAFAFRRRIAEEFVAAGVTNLAHLRYRIFTRAKHAPAVLLLNKKKPKATQLCLVHTPTLASQMVAQDGQLFSITIDNSDLKWVRATEAISDDRAWQKAFIWSPADNALIDRLNALVSIGRLSTIHDLRKKAGLQITQGDGEGLTGVPNKYIVTPEKVRGASNTRLALDRKQRLTCIPGLEASLFPKLPQEILDKLTGSYSAGFSGDVALIDRAFEIVAYIDHPVAYSSSFMGVHFSAQARREFDAHKRSRLLKAIANYLTSEVGCYLTALLGRRYMVDRRQLEASDLEDFPIPVKEIDDPRIDALADARPDNLSEVVGSLLRLSDTERATVSDFLEVRYGFRDGNLPAATWETPSDLSIYEERLRETLCKLFGRDEAFSVSARSVEENVGAVSIIYKRMYDSSASAWEQAMARSHDTITASRQISCIGNGQYLLVKPLSALKWSRDSAISDARAVLDFILDGGSAA